MQQAPWQRVTAWLVRALRRGANWSGLGLAGVLAVYFSFTSIYAFGVPHLRSYDEPSHVSYALSIWRGKLPHFDDPMPLSELGIRGHHTPQIWVAYHPPLYYALVAPAIGPAIEAGEPEVAVRNGRVASSVLGAVGLIYIFLTLRLLVPRRPAIAIGGTLLGALLPYFLNIMGAVFNDSAALLTSSGLLYASLLPLVRGPSRWRLVHVAIWIALASITRLSALFTVGPALLAVFLAYSLAPSQPWGKRLARAAGACSLLVAVGLASAGWWYLRNHQLYDDFTGAKPALEIFERNPKDPAYVLAQDPEIWEAVYDELWSIFTGAFRLDDDVKEIGHWFLIIGGAGLAWGAVSATARAAKRRKGWSLERPDRMRLIAAGVVVLSLLFYAYSLMEFHSRGGSHHARYLFPVTWMLGAYWALGLALLNRRFALPVGMVLSTLFNLQCAEAVLTQYIRQSHKSKALPAIEAFSKAGLESPTLTYGLLMALLATGLTLAVVAVVQTPDERPPPLRLPPNRDRPAQV